MKSVLDELKDIAWGVLCVMLLLSILFALCGCRTYKGGMVVEGTDLAVGLNIPSVEGTLEMDVLNYLSGFRLGIDKNARLVVKYTVLESNTYFGVIGISTSKTIDATMTPCIEAK